jgi:hypothetical protein
VENGITENNVKVKVWNNLNNSWQTINASVNTSSNSVTFETTNLSNFYILAGSAVTDIETEAALPTAYELKQNYPNPFNPTTTISYSLPVAGNITLKVYDILGNEVAQLANGFHNAGSYTLKFDGTNLASGIYLYRLTGGNFTSTKKLMLIK